MKTPISFSSPLARDLFAMAAQNTLNMMTQAKEADSTPKKSGVQPDGSQWGSGQCLSPAPDSQAGADLRAYYDRPGYTGN